MTFPVRIGFWFFVTLVTFVLAMSIDRARAHSWYEPACCSGIDCQPIPDTAVSITKEGYHVRYEGMFGLHIDVIVPFDKARPSKDEHYHGCNNSSRFLCLYVPQTV